ncbi:hypothetical protein HPP92_026152 [Vanilla planifolia]|uniref:Uncharacterized protein n=1 Tax=Vanilla planifolia TaxID=51239 RepID=A0A835PIJ1_VANPL|nr:hypothetical protein HPP92_026152 [Vanilla planifolia]
MDGGTSSGRQMELNDSVEHDLIHTPRPAKVPRFKPKIKGKAKVEGLSSSIQVTSLSHVSPKANATVAAGVTELGVGNLMETDDGNDAVVREISVFCGSGYLGEDAQVSSGFFLVEMTVYL